MSRVLAQRAASEGPRCMRAIRDIPRPLPARVRARTEDDVLTHPPPVLQDASITSEQFLDRFMQFELVPTPVC